jgi:coenzyme F420-reducing hydrogenase beta subunit
MNICPQKAITMKPDADGFLFPEINYDLCIGCRLCIKTCAFQKKPVSEKTPIAVYVAVNKDKNMRLASSSGGVFGAIATSILENGGVIFGCAYNNNMEPEHICIYKKSDLRRIQGSKYVQSNINYSYSEAKRYLKDGRQVLFSGTPCQIAGLKSYLGDEFENLATVDLICHGVPSSDFFKGYIDHLDQLLKGRIIDFKFRDKSKRGWVYRGKATYVKKGKIRYSYIKLNASYYFFYFLHGDTFRESCYECKYACGSREGDLTLGDYWGVEKAHKEFRVENGVSVILLNSKKGEELLESISQNVLMKESTFEQASKQNVQLKKPMDKSKRREMILKAWREGGYNLTVLLFFKNYHMQIIAAELKTLIPYRIKCFIKDLLIKLIKNIVY